MSIDHERHLALQLRPCQRSSRLTVSWARRWTFPAREWCLDVWDANAYSKQVALGREPVDPLGDTGDKDIRSLRGGCWVVPAEDLRAACRIRLWAGLRGDNVGFRVAAAPAKA